jgi:hypothetical protein
MTLLEKLHQMGNLLCSVSTVHEKFNESAIIQN